MTDNPETEDKLPCGYMEKIPQSHRYNCNFDENLCHDPINWQKCGKRYEI